MTNQQRI